MSPDPSDVVHVLFAKARPPLLDKLIAAGVGQFSDRNRKSVLK